MNDEIRRRILARRSVLVAAALATTTTTECKPRPCLEPAIDPSWDSGATAPTPCLSAPLRPCLEIEGPPPDAGAPAPDASREGGTITLAPMDIVADAGATKAPTPGPLVCLSRVRR